MTIPSFMADILTTERLLIRNFETADAEFLLQLVNSPSFIQFIGDKKMNTVQDAATYIRENYIKSYTDHGFGFWLVALASSNISIGGCGIMKRPDFSHPDIGYAFLPAYMGKGYAFEAASAVFDYAKNKLHLPKITAMVDEENARSRQLLKKLGMRYDIDVFMEGDIKKLMLYVEG